eukprot:gene21113-biopygen13170
MAQLGALEAGSCCHRGHQGQGKTAATRTGRGPDAGLTMESKETDAGRTRPVSPSGPKDPEARLGSQDMPAPRPRHAHATPAPPKPQNRATLAPCPRHARATVLLPLGAGDRHGRAHPRLQRGGGRALGKKAAGAERMRTGRGAHDRI